MKQETGAERPVLRVLGGDGVVVSHPETLEPGAVDTVSGLRYIHSIREAI